MFFLCHVADHYNNLEEKYDEFYRPFHSGVLDKALQHLNLQPDDRLVDIGGGTGALAEIMAERAGVHIYFVQGCVRKALLKKERILMPATLKLHHFFSRCMRGLPCCQ